jgi:hypothetical protein
MNDRFPPIADIGASWDDSSMIDPCCLMMRLYGRDHYRGVPESDLPDAMIEIHRDVGAAMLKTTSDHFDMFIQYCPWCGAGIGKTRDQLPKDFNPGFGDSALITRPAKPGVDPGEAALSALSP